MDGRRVQGVVDLELEEEPARAVEDCAARRPNDAGHPRVHDGARARDAHEACEDAVERHPHVEGLLEESRVQHPHHAPRSTSNCSVESHLGYKVAKPGESQGRPAVEAVPAEPQNEGAKGHQSGIVRGHRVNCPSDGIEAPLARPERDRAHKPRPATDSVHDARASEVDHTVGLLVEADDGAGVAVGVGARAPGREEAGAPHPVHNDGVDEGGDEDRVHEVGLDLAALRHGAGHDGGGGARERPLEEPRLPRVGVGAATAGAVVDVNDAEVGLADETALGLAIGEAVAKEPVAHGGPRGVEHVLEEDVLHVLARDGARLEHAEASLHEEHKGAAQDEPAHVHVRAVVASELLDLGVGLVDPRHELIPQRRHRHVHA
mmetsp:Transcript_54472/g.133155  ORF Transcript_54472/g.133155 Transcript_54472/m.133155 type:complete len:376 (-) Transcript_54472:64-1191(-)